jgi:hypothetical protein
MTESKAKWIISEIGITSSWKEKDMRCRLIYAINSEYRLYSNDDVDKLWNEFNKVFPS